MSEAQPNGVGPGALLKNARVMRDMTQQDVSDALNLMLRVIDDIENERWSQLPPPAFSRGYLRAYAKLLVLDPDMIVRAFDSALGQTGGGQAVLLRQVVVETCGGRVLVTHRL